MAVARRVAARFGRALDKFDEPRSRPNMSDPITARKFDMRRFRACQEASGRQKSRPTHPYLMSEVVPDWMLASEVI